MRDLTADKNTLKIQDPISNSNIELYYRMPETSEMQKYRSEAIIRKGRKLKLRTFEAQLKYGLIILTGFRDGDFGAGGKHISSNPDCPNQIDVDGKMLPLVYREDWKDILKDKAADLVIALASHVFEKPRTDMSESLFEFVDEEDEEGAEEIPPLAKSSGD